MQAAKIHNTSATSFVIRRDSRDSLFAATKGSDNSVSVEMAGLGGDTAFVRYIAESGWYFPLKMGFHRGGPCPGRRDEQVVAGGRCRLTNCSTWAVSTPSGALNMPKSAPGTRVTNDRIGGTHFLQFNQEIRFPLYKKLGLDGDHLFRCR